MGDDTIMIRHNAREAQHHLEKMRMLFEEADAVDVDGVISPAEWSKIASCPAVRMWLSSMGLDCDTPESLFVLLDENEVGYLTLDGLVRGVGKLKGTARSIDLVAIMRALGALQDRVKKIDQNVAGSRHLSSVTV